VTNDCNSLVCDMQCPATVTTHRNMNTALNNGISHSSIIAINRMHMLSTSLLFTPHTHFGTRKLS